MLPKRVTDEPPDNGAFMLGLTSREAPSKDRSPVIDPRFQGVPWAVNRWAVTMATRPDEGKATAIAVLHLMEVAELKPTLGAEVPASRGRTVASLAATEARFPMTVTAVDAVEGMLVISCDDASGASKETAREIVDMPRDRGSAWAETTIKPEAQDRPPTPEETDLTRREVWDIDSAVSVPLPWILASAEALSTLLPGVKPDPRTVSETAPERAKFARVMAEEVPEETVKR